MNKLLRALRTPRGRHAATETGAPPARRDGVRHRSRRGTAAAVAGAVGLLTIVAPAHAGSSEVLGTGSGRLLGHGAEVQVRVSYQCEEGLNAGIGIFLTQTNRHGPEVVGGAGSGQRPCTGGPQTVTLTIPARSSHFRPGSASAAVSLFTSASGTPGAAGQLTENIRLDHRR